MNRRLATILQVITVFVGVGVLGLLLWEPHVEGRNTHSTLTETYFDDPFLTYAYVGSIPFFIAVYYAFLLLGWLGSGEAGSSQRAANAARVIKACVGAAIGFIAVGVVVLIFVGEERPPAVALGVLATLPVLLIRGSVVVYERFVHRTAD